MSENAVYPNVPPTSHNDIGTTGEDTIDNNDIGTTGEDTIDNNDTHSQSTGNTHILTTTKLNGEPSSRQHLGVEAGRNYNSCYIGTCATSPTSSGAGSHISFGVGSPISFGVSPVCSGAGSPVCSGVSSHISSGVSSYTSFGVGSPISFGAGSHISFGVCSPISFGVSPISSGAGSPVSSGVGSPIPLTTRSLEDEAPPTYNEVLAAEGTGRFPVIVYGSRTRGVLNFHQTRRESNENNSNSEETSTKDCSDHVSNIFTNAFIYGVFAGLPMAMVITGASHLDDCPMNPYIPKFMITSGSIACLLLLMLQLFVGQDIDNIVFTSFLVGLLTALVSVNLWGSAIIFQKWKEWYRHLKLLPAIGCHSGTYIFGFSLLVVFWLLFPCVFCFSKDSWTS